MPSSPANEGPDVVPRDGCHRHGHGLRRGQPVGVIVPGGEVAHVVDVAEEEGHCAELAQTAASRTCTGENAEGSESLRSGPHSRLMAPVRWRLTFHILITKKEAIRPKRLEWWRVIGRLDFN